MNLRKLREVVHCLSSEILSACVNLRIVLALINFKFNTSVND